MFKLMKAIFIYASVIGVGAIVIATTQVATRSESGEAKEIALDVIGELKSYISLLTGGLSDRPETEDSVALPEELSTPPVKLSSAFVSETVKPPVLSEQCASQIAGPDGVVIGDRIKLRVFEKASVLRSESDPLEPGSGDRVIFERLDLSGAYEVDQGGEVSLPLLGRIQVSGAKLACVESMAVVRYFDLVKAEAMVNASFDSRPQVTVIGAVSAPGSYPYTPGLTAGVLVARAGVTTGGGLAALSRKSSLVARQSELQALVMSADIELRRLEAILDRRSELKLTSAELARAEVVLGPKRVARETLALRASVDAMRLADEQDKAEAAALAAQVEELLAQDKMVETQLQTLYDRRDDLKDFRERGYVLATQVDSTVFNIMLSERFQQEIQGKLLDVKSRLHRAALATRLRDSELRQSVAGQIRDIAEESNGLAGQINTLQAELRFLETETAGAGDGAEIVLIVARQGIGGLTELEVSPASRILPGDLVTVMMSDSLTQKVAQQDAADPAGLLLPVNGLLQP